MATAGPDETEWSRLYLESYPSVFRALVATLFDEEAAADAMHDAFIEGLRRPPRHRQNVAGWLFRVALRKARDARRQSQLLLPLSWLLGLPHESREPSVADRVLDRIAEWPPASGQNRARHRRVRRARRRLDQRRAAASGPPSATWRGHVAEARIAHRAAVPLCRRSARCNETGRGLDAGGEDRRLL